MKHWQETSRILDRAAGLARAGRPFALATVVRIEGSAYRRPGAKMLVEDGGDSSGGVSGGCLEDDVREVARSLLPAGAPRLLHYDTGADDQPVWGLGLGCNGSVDVFVQPGPWGGAPEVGERVRELLRQHATFAVAAVVEGPTEAGRAVVVAGSGVVAGTTGDPGLDRALAARAGDLLAARESLLHEVGGVRAFTEVLEPPPRLLVLGAGDDARPVAAYAADAGFRVTVVDHRAAYLAPGRFPEGTDLLQARPEDGLAGLGLREEEPGRGGGPGPADGRAQEPAGDRAQGSGGAATFAVVMTHSLARDRDWLARLIRSDVPYIGLLGPRARTEDILLELGVAGSERVYGPVGLDLGADGAEQVALSIVAELLAVRVGREPRHLRAREGAIHAG